MAEVWQVQLGQPDRKQVTLLAERRRGLGLPSSFTETIRAAVRLALSASDEDLRKGEL